MDVFNLISKGKFVATLEDTSKEKVFVSSFTGWRYPRFVIDVKNLNKYKINQQGYVA